ncbi:hypothetical protein [Streptomyces sp. MNP-20]|uniref:hypothetical protein n=1 Tax=Streptomyces sp. MNP-20 TaxID=2721165 RepID=UPI0015519102|nr:hypothetical protein [Streptomyces sp. MNP-20]
METFGCDWDETQAVTLQHDKEHVVAIIHTVGDREDGEWLYLAPEKARQVARAITLASLAVEGVDVTQPLFVAPETATSVDPHDAIPVEPCPDTNHECDPLCSARKSCQESTARTPARTPDAEPEPALRGREGVFLAARRLAGPAASLAEVLTLARYLEG